MSKNRVSLINGQQFAIHYCNRNRNHTSRIIIPEKIEENSYDEITRIKAHSRRKGQRKRERRGYVPKN